MPGLDRRAGAIALPDSDKGNMADLTDKSNTTPVSGLESAEKSSGAACATTERVSKRGRVGEGMPKGFAAATAEATGQTKRTTQTAPA